MEPDLISQFDLLFILTDHPKRDRDEAEADHILDVTYAGEVQANRDHSSSPVVDRSTVSDASEEVTPAIEPDLLRRYIAYARQNYYPAMTDETKEVIREFYIEIRSQGYEGDTPVPVTSRKLEAVVRLAEASARLRLSETIEKEDANRVTTLVRKTLESLGIDPETGDFDTGVVETGQKKSQRDRGEIVKKIIKEIEPKYNEGVPIEAVLDHAEEIGIEQSKAEHELMRWSG